MLSLRQSIILLPLAFCLPLAANIYVGTNSRYMADDYCIAARVREYGFWGSQLYAYENWAGRFSAHFLEAAAGSLGVGLARVVPAIVTLGLVGGLTILFGTVLRKMGVETPWRMSALLAILGSYATLQEVPNLYQSMYWQDAAIFHSIPLALVAAFSGWLVSRTGPAQYPSPRHLALGATLVFGFGLAGFNEALTNALLVGLVCTFFIVWAVRRGPLQTAGSEHLIAALLGVMIGLAVDLAAPGNLVRRAAYPEPPGVGYLLVTSLKDVGHFVKLWLASWPFASLISGLLAFLAGAASKASASPEKRTPGWIFLIGLPAFGLLLLYTIMFTLEVATSSYPAYRVLTVAQLIVSIIVVGWSWIAGVMLGSQSDRVSQPKTRVRLAGVMILCGLVAAASFTGTARALRWWPETREFALAWDQRDARIRSAVQGGASTIRVPSLTSMGTIGELSYDPDDWLNKCVAEYYGLDRVYAK